MPRVLFVGGFPPPGSGIRGGIVTSSQALLASSFAQRFTLDLIDSTQRSIPSPGVVKRAFFAARRVATFIARLERRRPDAVVAFSSQGASFIEKSACAAYARLRGVPVVLLMRGGPFMDDCRGSRTYRRLARLLLRVPAAIACQGESWHLFFRDELQMPPERLPVVHNWTAREDYLALPRDDRRDPLQILFMGWVDREKGIHELLGAAEELWRDPAVPRFELHVAGGGTQADAVRARIERDGFPGRVVLHGWVDDPAKAALLRQAAIFTLPSYAEGMPNAMIEAMAAGVPIVVTPVGGIPDVIRHAENGILVPPADQAALRDALGALLRSEADRRRLGEAARRTARDTFGVERGAGDLARVVSAVIAGRTPAGQPAGEPAELPGLASGGRLQDSNSSRAH